MVGSLPTIIKQAKEAEYLAMKQKMPKVMARTDVAEYLGVSRQYVDRLVKEGKLPSQETSAGTIFMESDVIAYKKERLQKAKTDTRIKLKKRQMK